MATDKEFSFGDAIMKRFYSETPKFFKKIIDICVSIGVLGGTLIALPEFINLPDIIQTIGGYMVAIGMFGSVIAKLTTTSPTLRAKSEEAVK